MFAQPQPQQPQYQQQLQQPPRPPNGSIAIWQNFDQTKNYVATGKINLPVDFLRYLKWALDNGQISTRQYTDKNGVQHFEYVLSVLLYQNQSSGNQNSPALSGLVLVDQPQQQQNQSPF